MRAVSSGFINKKAVKAIVPGAVIGILFTILITVLCSLAITFIGKLPDNALYYITLGILALGSFIGGYISARIYKSAGIIIGVFTGLIIFLIVFLAGINSIYSGVSLFTLFKFLVIIVFSVIGAIMGVNKKEKLRYK